MIARYWISPVIEFRFPTLVVVALHKHHHSLSWRAWVGVVVLKGYLLNCIRVALDTGLDNSQTKHIELNLMSRTEYLQCLAL